VKRSNPIRARTSRLLLATLLAWGLGTGAASAVAATAYVSDELTVPLRTGATNGHRILRMLSAGTRLEVHERNPGAGYARVTTETGAEGWVPLQYLAEQPIARDRLAAANREVERLNQTVAQLQARLQATQGVSLSAEETSTNLSSDIGRLQQELADVRRASATAIETAAANQRLTELNARLREELDLLIAERDRLAANNEQRWLLMGGGLVMLGLLIGMFLKTRPRRSAWS
jgi:SH3 domain protein